MLHSPAGVGGESSFREMLVLSTWRDSALQLSSHPLVSLLFHFPSSSEAKALKLNFAPVGSSYPSAPNIAES